MRIREPSGYWATRRRRWCRTDEPLDAELHILSRIDQEVPDEGSRSILQRFSDRRILVETEFIPRMRAELRLKQRSDRDMRRMAAQPLPWKRCGSELTVHSSCGSAASTAGFSNESTDPPLHSGQNGTAARFPASPPTRVTDQLWSTRTVRLPGSCF
jgi:hypothetical protein